MATPKKNAGKAPSVQFYYKDFLADMQEHPPEIVGAWMMVLIKIWHAKSNGEITRTITQYARIMSTTEQKAKQYIDYFESEGIGDVSKRNGKITVLNRRAERDAKLLEQNRLRQESYRKRHAENGPVTVDGNGDVTGEKRNPSSSSSSSPSAKKKVLFPLPGKACGKRGCPLPAVYKNIQGDYDSFTCLKHSPEEVREMYD